MGLASAALADRGVKAVALLPGVAGRPWVPAGVENWAPEDGALEAFVSELFEKTGPDGVVWEVWPAFERLAPETALDWGRRFRDTYRTVQGSWLTQHRFGHRFWRNALRNFLGWDHPATPVLGSRPLVIAASGPSLDEGIDVLARNRGRIDLWALPSSFETLVRRDLVPDAGVTSDGGFYAREHLHRLSGTQVPLLAALGSASDPVLAGRRCFFFSQGMPVEQALLETLVPEVPQVPSQGTVAVTALRLALQATTGPVFIAGLDLAFRDLRGHTSPHTVDRRLEALQGRLTPGEGLWADRLFDQATVLQDGVRTSPALLTYAGWFRSRARFSRPVFRIAPSALRWNTMTELDWGQAQTLWTTHPGRRAIEWLETRDPPSQTQRLDAVRRTFRDLRNRIERCPPDDPWLVEAARTAVPEALALDFLARRSGRPGTAAQAALLPFLQGLEEEFL